MSKTKDEVIEVINQALTNVDVSWNGSVTVKGFKQVKVDKNHPISSDYGIQGESNITVYIFELLPEENLFLRVETGTDSYGNEAHLSNLKIVRGQEKTVKIFEYE